MPTEGRERRSRAPRYSYPVTMPRKGSPAERLNDACNAIHDASLLLNDLLETVERALAVLDHRTARAVKRELDRQPARAISKLASREELAREEKVRHERARQKAELLMMPPLLGRVMQRAVENIDSIAKEAESIVWHARDEVDVLQEEYEARLVRAAQRAQHSDVLTAIRTSRDQLNDTSSEMWTLPEMNHLEPDSVPTMTVGELRELLESARSTTLHMQERYEAVIQKPYEIVLS